jgi:aminoglycoside phosphotransferase (APT) family kinase protein
LSLPDGVWQVLGGLMPPGAEVRVLASGWDSEAFAVGDLVIKHPKHPAAAIRLRREAALLGLVRPRVRLAVPDLHLVEGPLLWSWHRMLPGDHLLAADYVALPEAGRDRLAVALAGLMADLHGIDLGQARAAGALDLPPWRAAAEVLTLALPHLPRALHAAARQLVADVTALPPDPLGQVYGQFDGHGWNMAFDPVAGVLNGVYDFADSGLGPAHQDFIYAGLVSFDLMQRVARAYQAETGHPVDHQRITVLAGMHRLWELAEAGTTDDPADYVTRFADWAQSL